MLPSNDINARDARKIAFYTPQGTYTVAEVVFNASSTPVVKGRVFVDSDGNTEISVTEGRMVFATSEGMKTVDANHKIVLAVAPAPAITQFSTTFWVVAALVTGGIIAVIVDNNNDSKNTVVSPPSRPTVDNMPSKKKKSVTVSTHK